MKSTLLALVVFALQLAVSMAQAPQQHTPFSMGDIVIIECPKILPNGSVTTEFEPLHCADTDSPFALLFGIDAMFRCVWPLDDGMYNMMRLSLANQASYSCRLPISKDATLFFPLTFSFWGQYENEHMHLMTHWNFLLHAIDGFFLGGSVYPLMDHYVVAQQGKTFLIHGPVRWFVGHTFESSVMDAWISESADQPSEPLVIPAGNKDQEKKPQPPPRKGIVQSGGSANVRPVSKDELPTISKIVGAIPRNAVITYVILSAWLTAGIAALVYTAYLKPKLLREKKQNLATLFDDVWRLRVCHSFQNYTICGVNFVQTNGNTTATSPSGATAGARTPSQPTKAVGTVIAIPTDLVSLYNMDTDEEAEVKQHEICDKDSMDN
ncbi:hypothetical protein HDU76_010602, partial [Blyttiomyces sp. JEL0837]